MHVKNNLSNFLNVRTPPRSPNQTHIGDLSSLHLEEICSKGVYI